MIKFVKNSLDNYFLELFMDNLYGIIGFVLKELFIFWLKVWNKNLCLMKKLKNCEWKYKKLFKLIIVI